MRYEIEIMQVEDADWPSDRLLSNRIEDAGDDFVAACSRAEQIAEEEELAVGADYVTAQVVGYRKDDDDDDGEIMFSCRKGAF